MALDDKDRLSIFNKNSPHLATKKVGKNNSKAEEIKADNEIRMEWKRLRQKERIIKGREKDRDYRRRQKDTR